MSDTSPFDPAPYGQQPAGPPAYGQQPYAPEQYGGQQYGQQPYGTQPYGGPSYGAMGDGPVGRLRSTGTTILLFFVTFTIYGYIYNFQVHDEMKRHTGRGVGGGVALLLTFLAGIAMPFVTPSEVGSLYTRKGQKPPVSGVTGLWYLLSLVAAYVVGLIGLIVAFAAGSTTTESGNTTLTTAGGVGLALAGVAFVAVAIAGGVIWFVKTNGALNRYWEAQGASPAGRPVG